MAYLPAAIELDPKVYFSFSFVDDFDSPRDIVSDSSLVFSGDYFYSDPTPPLSRYIVLEDKEFMSLDSNELDYLSDLSFVFWNSDAIIDSSRKDIFYWGDEQDYISVYVESDQIFVDISSSVVSVPQDDLPLRNFSVVFDLDQALVFYNSILVSSATFVEQRGNFFDPRWGSLSDEEASGDSKFSDIAVFEYPLSENQIKSLYQIGAFGSEIFSISSPAPLSFSGRVRSAIQTSWQSYVDIFTKR